MILLTGHFTTLEIGARLVALHRDFHVMYRPYSNPVADFWLHRVRQRGSRLPALPRDELRGLVRALREGRAIWYAPDQTLHPKHSVFVPFFGVPAATVTALSRIAKLADAVVVPAVTRQLPGGDGYILRFYPAWDFFPTPDVAADVRRMNAFIEDRVREMPEQYFWLHKRFKTRPPGERRFYPE